MKLRPAKECTENKKKYVKQIKGLNFEDVYCVVGEVADINHYVVMNLRTGKVLNGMFHLTRFRAATDEDL